MEYIDLVKARRSTYMLENKQVVEDDELVKSLEEVIKEAPTAFNSMATHIVIALGKEHAFIWDTTKGILKGIVSPEAFKKTGPKIDVFKAAYGTILVYKDIEKIDDLKKSFPGFSNRQDYWGEQNVGILAYALWLELVNLGYGANMQHYDPLIDDVLMKRYSIPKTWKLEAQIVFGKTKVKADKKDYLPLKERVIVVK
ncbi:MAG: nitroreductase family protein [Bacilli bacterium]|jgi:uncharacterized protein